VLERSEYPFLKDLEEFSRGIFSFFSNEIYIFSGVIDVVPIDLARFKEHGLAQILGHPRGV
jgi:hypothetical protein